MENLREIRKLNKYNQSDIAKILGVTVQTYSRYELGIIKIMPENLIKLADFFGTTTDYLLGRTQLHISIKGIETIYKHELERAEENHFKYFDKHFKTDK